MNSSRALVMSLIVGTTGFAALPATAKTSTSVVSQIFSRPRTLTPEATPMPPPPPTLAPPPPLQAVDRARPASGEATIKGRLSVLFNDGETIPVVATVYVLGDSPYVRWVVRSLAVQWNRHQPGQPWLALRDKFENVRTMSSDTEGYWSMHDLAPGRYDVLEMGSVVSDGGAIQSLVLLATDTPISVTGGNVVKLQRDDMNASNLQCITKIYNPNTTLYDRDNTCRDSLPQRWLRL